MDELRVCATTKLSQLKKGGVATAVGVDPALHRKALLGIQSRLDGLSSRVGKAGGVCLQLMRSASELKSQADAVSKLPATLKGIVVGLFDGARLASREVLSQLTAALNTAASTVNASASNAQHGPRQDLTFASSSDASPLAIAISEREDFRQQAISVAGQARDVLDQFEGIMAEESQLQVSRLSRGGH